MTLLSSQSVAIAMAKNNGTLRIVESFNDRLQAPYWAICDYHGLIEIALSEAEAKAIIGQ